jgi:hypothetical protein
MKEVKSQAVADASNYSARFCGRDIMTMQAIFTGLSAVVYCVER